MNAFWFAQGVVADSALGLFGYATKGKQKRGGGKGEAGKGVVNALSSVLAKKAHDLARCF